MRTDPPRVSRGCTDSQLLLGPLQSGPTQYNPDSDTWGWAALKGSSQQPSQGQTVGKWADPFPPREGPSVEPLCLDFTGRGAFFWDELSFILGGLAHQVYLY